ncbi:isochorismatase [Pseudoalteromonas sp. NBT06-2]|uniref:cysteine hydrolase family protein n=1 Tax=Pseudoalteromonas sp. NBT06-2 TaxID=2025950 RepID=UPI000BA60B0B|nr:cysteine hydrolase family protein [Pseudoalteromonas sp. NBT06-2]PAJ76290.1 isochorismatase [Pseudoalteromonas sp. NBT06-2]
MSQLIRNNVKSASLNWIKNFNNGDVQACIDRYLPSAIMQVYPFGKFNSKQEISDFWLNFAKSNPTDLVYKNIQIKVLNKKQAILSANWSMNIASGIISKELWTLADDGQWYLEEDDFSVLTQLTEPLNEKQRTALVLVDFQNDYFEGGKFQLEETEKAANQASKLLSKFRDENLPVIHIQHIFEDEQATFFAPDTIGIEIHHSVAPKDNEVVIVKHYIDSFTDTDLEQTLIELGIHNLVIVGAMAQACVQTICRSATHKGYQCTVIEDAIAAPKLAYKDESFEGKQIIAANLLSLTFGGAKVCTLDDYLTNLHNSSLQ